jgi:homoserine kinase type II
MCVKVYLLWFVSESDKEDDDGLLIGVYESESSATAAIERLRTKPGFVDYPLGFQIHPRELGQDSWTEGFVRD